MIYRYGCFMIGLGMWCTLRAERDMIAQQGFTKVGRNAVGLMTRLALEHRAQHIRAQKHRKPHHRARGGVAS